MFGAKKKFKRPKAGYLTIGSPMFKPWYEGLKRGTYDERAKAKAAANMADLTDEIEVIPSGIVYTREEIEEAMQLFFREKTDFVMVEFMSWAEDFSWIHFLRDMPKMPLLFLNEVKEEMPFDNSMEDDDFVEFLCNTSIVGALEASGSVRRMGRENVTMIMGSRQELNEQIRKYAKAAKVRGVLSEATVGLLANYNEIMWITYTNPYNLFTKLGPELKSISYAEYFEVIQEVSEKEVQEYMDNLLATYKVDEGTDMVKMKESVRAAIGMVKLAEKYDIDAMIYNDLDAAMLKLIGCRPGFYHPALNENLSVLVPEADMAAGLMTFMLKILSGGKQVNFIEAFYIENGPNTFAAGHAGPNDYNDPAFKENVRITTDAFLLDRPDRYAGAAFAWYRMPAGRKTMAHFSEKDGHYTVIVTLVDSLEGEHILKGYSHTILKPVVPVKKLFKEILEIGATQHYALVDGDYREELKMLSDMMGFDYHEI